MQTLLKDSPVISSYVDAVLKVNPEHEIYLRKSFEQHSPEILAILEKMASLAKKIIGDDLSDYARDYYWMCEEFKNEQLYFHRHKEYRLKTLREAKEKVYDDSVYMGKYIRGILLSQFMWSNHAHSFYLFAEKFLKANPVGYHHLDIGSGHGLFLALAAQDKNCGALNAWDISEASLESTKNALRSMGINTPLSIRKQDLLEETDISNSFDSVICSEVLEHTENPRKGLQNIFKVLKQGGRAFINVPVNSPAPDHIYLWRTTDAVRDLLRECGFDIEFFGEFPASGMDLERAKKFNFDISCVAILKKPA